MRYSLPLIAALSAAELKRIPEAEFQRAVVEHARSRGWKVHFTHYGATRLQSGRWVGTAQEGWPDLYIARSKVALAWELKAERGTASAEQKDWLETLDGATVTSGLWKPRNAVEILRRLK